MEGLGLQRPVGCRLGVGCRCCFAFFVLPCLALRGSYLSCRYLGRS